MTSNDLIQEAATMPQPVLASEGIRELTLEEALAVAGGPQVTNDANI